MDEMAKWMGGALGPGAKIYAVPHHLDQVLSIDLTTDNSLPTVGHDVISIKTNDMGSDASGRSSWVGGVLDSRSGAIFAIPSFAESVLRIDCMAGTAYTFGEGELGEEGPCKWAGGVLGPDQAIYAIPANARSVLRVDPVTNTFQSFGDLGHAGKDWRWRGGVLGPDGAIYGIPFDSRHVLRIDPTSQHCEVLGDDLGDMEGKWDGGVLGPDGAIYGIPSRSSGVLRIDVTTRRSQVLEVPNLSEGLMEGKWSGGVLGADEAIWGIPHAANELLRIQVGVNGVSNGDFSIDMVPVPLGNFTQKEHGLRKWSGGVLGPDLSLWGIPCTAMQPFRIPAIPVDPKPLYYELVLLLRLSSKTASNAAAWPLKRGSAVFKAPVDPGLLMLQRILLSFGEGSWFLQRVAQYKAGLRYLVGPEETSYYVNTRNMINSQTLGF